MLFCSPFLPWSAHPACLPAPVPTAPPPSVSLASPGRGPHCQTLSTLRRIILTAAVAWPPFSTRFSAAAAAAAFGSNIF